MTRPTVPYSVISSLDEKRRERAGFDKPAVLETPEAELFAASDRADKAWEVWNLEQVPLTEGEAKQKVARAVDDARPKLVAAFKAADRDELRDVQARLAAVVDEVDRIQVDLATRGDAA